MQSCGKEESSAALTAESSGEESVQDAAETTTTGTASDSGTDTETSTTAAPQSSGQTAADGNTEYIPVDPDSPDCANAKARVEAYLNAMKIGDADTALEIMDIERTLAYMQSLYSGEESAGYSLDEMKQSLRESVEEAADSSFRYTIVGVYEVPGYREQIDEMFAELDENIEELRDSDDPDKQAMLAQYDSQMELMRDMLNFDKLYFFDCDVTAEGETEETPLIMVQRNGEWYLEMTFMPAMIGYVKKSKISSANSAAKTVYHAAQSALTDMDAEGYDITELEDTYTWQGSDFENVTKPASITAKDEKLRYLRYLISQYYSDITELQQIGIVIADSSCTAVAADCGELSTLRQGTCELFGTYPNMVTADNFNTVSTLAEALRFAEPEYDR